MPETYLQTHGTAIGTKMAVAFANIFIALETKLIRQRRIKPIEWKCSIDDVFLSVESKQTRHQFVHWQEHGPPVIEQTNQFHPSIKFPTEISESEKLIYLTQYDIQRGWISNWLYLWHTYIHTYIHRKSEHFRLKIREKSGNAEDYIRKSKYAGCYDYSTGSIQETRNVLFQKSEDVCTVWF